MTLQDYDGFKRFWEFESIFKGFFCEVVSSTVDSLGVDSTYFRSNRWKIFSEKKQMQSSGGAFLFLKKAYEIFRKTGF